MDDAQARGELLEALRVSRGLTQTQLAKASKISQAVISKAESGEDLDDDRWQTLAQVLAVPTDVFSSVRHSAAPARIFHRKRKTTPQAAVNKVAAELALVRLRIRGLLERPPVRLRAHDLEDGFVTPQEVAQLVRADLNLGTGPLEDLVGVLEAAGVVILRWPLESVHVDAIASWQQGEVPIILVGEHVPPDRQRFTMAHELGHAVMHDTEATASQEAEADAFAGEFLLPGARLVQEWVPAPTLNDFLALKRRWRISLAALIRRARDVDLLSEDDYRRWSIQLSSTGMHRREPEPSQRENPTALTASIREAVDAGVSVEELAARAFMYPFEFELTFMQEDA